MDWISDEPFSKTYKDIYFSKQQAIKEARFVYIQGNNLPLRWKNLKKNEVFNILELGFGAGINFFTTLKDWVEHHKKDNWLNYLSIENEPLSLKDYIKVIKKYSELDFFSKKLIDSYPINCKGPQRIEFKEERVSLTIYFGEASKVLRDLDPKVVTLDACYHDGFAPQKNEEMWSSEIFSFLANLSHSKTTYSTFSSAKIVKERLRENGFKLKTIKGFGNKRHMLKAEFKASPIKRQRQLKKNIAVIGAGIAGCTLAKILSSGGHQVSLFEKSDHILSGASGNKALVMYPRLSAFDTPYSLFSLHSYLFSTKFYDGLSTSHWNKTGVLLLDFNEDTHKRFKQLIKARDDSKIFETVTSEEASSIAGTKLSYGALFFPDAGWINPKGACEEMLKDSKIEFISEKVKKVSESQVVSNLKDYTFDHVCLSCSFDSTDLIELKGLVKKRGQVTYIQDDGELKNLKVPICAEGYISPTSEGIKIVGSTYNNKNNENTTLEDNLENIKKLRLISDQEVKVVGSDSGYRATTRDHLPLVGKTKGIFINIGHGSRGLSSAPITGQFISDLISGSHPVFGKDVIKSLYPERFKGKV